MARRIEYIVRGGDLGSRVEDVITSGQVGPPMPDWSAVDRAELRRDAIVGRELVAAFPISLLECDPDAMDRIGREHARQISDLLNVPVFYGGHHASKAEKSDPRGTHMHFAWPPRTVDETGKIGEKTRILDNRNTSGAVIAMLRGMYQDLVNRDFAAAGLRERLDLRTRQAQGLEGEALERIPKREFQRARRGEIHSAKYAYNQAILALRRAQQTSIDSAAKLGRAIRNAAFGLAIRTHTRINARRRAIADRRRARERTLGASGRRLPAPSRRFQTDQTGDMQRKRADRGGPDAPRNVAASDSYNQRGLSSSLPPVDIGRTARRDRSRRDQSAPQEGPNRMADRNADPRGPKPERIAVTPNVLPTTKPTVGWITSVVRWITGASRHEKGEPMRTAFDATPKAERSGTEVVPRVPIKRQAPAERVAQEPPTVPFDNPTTVSTEEILSSDLPLLLIHTATGGTYYARRKDWVAAHERDDTNVGLCTENGDALPESAKKHQLRMSTFEKSVVRLVDVPKVDVYLSAEEPVSDQGISI